MSVTYLGFQSEPCFAALLTLLAGTQLLIGGQPTGGNAFVTTGRKATPVASVGAALQPALYLLEGEVDYTPDDAGLSKDELACAAIVYFRNHGGDQGIPAQTLNQLRDSVVFQMRQRTLSGNSIISLTLGERQTLGGTCYTARIKGKALANEGLLNNQGAIVFPISILTGL